MMVMWAKVYRLNGEFGVQVWFLDGASVRFDGFGSEAEAVNYIGETWGDVHVAID